MKKSHIRVPVINVPVPAADLNSNLIGFDGKVNSLRKHGLSVNTSFALLWDGLNEAAVAALKACGIIPGHFLSLNVADFETTDVFLFKESVASLLLSGIRGLLDDRKV